MWDDRDRKRRHITLRDAGGFRPPCNDFLVTIAEHPNFDRIDDIIDQDRNFCLHFRGEEDSGGEDDDDAYIILWEEFHIVILNEYEG